MLHSNVIFWSISGPDDTRQLDLRAWMSVKEKLPTNLLQIFCRTFLTSQVIIKIIKNPKTICRGTPKHERVKSIFGELFEGEIFVRKLSTNLLQIFCLPKLLSIQSRIQMTISRGTPNLWWLKAYLLNYLKEKYLSRILNLQISVKYFVELLPLPELLSKLSKTQRTISRGTPKHEMVKSIFGEIFAGEMFFRILLTNILQIICKSFLASQDIINTIKEPDDNWQSRHSRVLTVYEMTATIALVPRG